MPSTALNIRRFQNNSFRSLKKVINNNTRRLIIHTKKYTKFVPEDYYIMPVKFRRLILSRFIYIMSPILKCNISNSNDTYFILAYSGPHTDPCGTPGDMYGYAITIVLYWLRQCPIHDRYRRYGIGLPASEEDINKLRKALPSIKMVC